jgi:hypothetical protein
VGGTRAVTVAALYVDPNGAYANLTGVEVWDEARDARTYDGPWPVVAHPPCARWCALAPLNAAINAMPIGDDAGCFEAALQAVHTHGGVIEHPANSFAWKRFGLPLPQTKGGWSSTLGHAGFSCYVEQSAYGHVIEPGWYVRHDRGTECKRRGPDRIRDKRASATPPAFRDVLLAMARSAARERVAAPA